MVNLIKLFVVLLVVVPGSSWAGEGADPPVAAPPEGLVPAPAARDAAPAQAAPEAVPPAPTARLVHVPVVDAESDKPLDLVIFLEDLAGVGQVEVLYRRLGREEYHSLGFERRVDGRYVATIPALEVVPPGLEYYIVSGPAPSRVARFASAEVPHQVVISGASLQARMERDLERYGGRRSEATASYELVDFGVSGALDERYWRVGASYTYRPLRTVRMMRFGVARMRGEGITLHTVDVDGVAVEEPVADPSGVDYGFGEIEIALREELGVRLRGSLGANESRFTAGGGAVVRIGLDPGTHLTVELDGILGTGGEVGVRLHWDTVPHLPMAAGMAITTLPNQADWALALLYDVRVPLSHGFFADLGVRYQSRSDLEGGFGGGVGFVYAF